MRAETGPEPPGEDRFDRLRRISWWNHKRLREARVLVIGAGALGNEVLKNLALLGVGHVLVADLDTIETSNLSRSILFRDSDCGRPKSQVAAERMRDIYPGVNAHWFHGDVIHELGAGVYAWADVVITGLDNREARLHVNRCCWKTGTPWVDGATEVLQGVARVFVPPDTACYECTMTEADWKVLSERVGCAGLKAEFLPEERVPTTPITASLVAAVQCQEALKLLQGLPSLAGQGLVINGIANDFYTVRYNRAEDCNSHEAFDELASLERSAGELTGLELVAEAERRLGAGVVIEFNQDLVVSLDCPACGRSDAVFRPRRAVPESAARCPDCGQLRRVESTQSACGSEPYLARPLAQIGVPPYDILGARKGMQRLGFLLAGDAPAVLGPLAGVEAGVDP